MPSVAELEKTKRELARALLELDKLEELSDTLKKEDAGQIPPLSHKNRSQATASGKAVPALETRTVQEKNSRRLEEEAKERNETIVQLQTVNQAQQAEIEKVKSEKALISQILKNTQGENEIISRVLEKMSKDYDDLKRVIESQKCSKDDKIMALRKTARALETENELLQEEKMMIEKERLRVHQNFLSQIRQLEMTISRQQQQLDDGNTEKRTLVVKVQQLDTEKQKLTATVANMDREIAACKSQLSKKKKK